MSTEINVPAVADGPVRSPPPRNPAARWSLTHRVQRVGPEFASAEHEQPRWK